jgi:hypothetical protein
MSSMMTSMIVRLEGDNVGDARDVALADVVGNSCCIDRTLVTFRIRVFDIA